MWNVIRTGDSGNSRYVSSRRIGHYDDLPCQFLMQMRFFIEIMYPLGRFKWQLRLYDYFAQVKFIYRKPNLNSGKWTSDSGFSCYSNTRSLGTKWGWPPCRSTNSPSPTPIVSSFCGLLFPTQRGYRRTPPVSLPLHNSRNSEAHKRREESYCLLI